MNDATQALPSLSFDLESPSSPIDKENPVDSPLITSIVDQERGNIGKAFPRDHSAIDYYGRAFVIKAFEGVPEDTLSLRRQEIGTAVLEFLDEITFTCPEDNRSLRTKEAERNLLNFARNLSN